VPGSSLPVRLPVIAGFSILVLHVARPPDAPAEKPDEDAAVAIPSGDRP
jgi:hypothetical protein